MRFVFAFLSIISKTTTIFFVKVSYILQWHVFCYISYWCIRFSRAYKSNTRITWLGFYRFFPHEKLKISVSSHCQIIKP